MTFKDIAVKNLKSQIKRYLSYFLCSSFSIMIFFIYSTLLFNKSIKSKDDIDLISLVFKIGLVSVGLFSVFFINYAHSAFIKSRHKEFGVYMTLGMSQGDIRKIVLLENALIIFASLCSGLISGLVFSRLFQMIVLKLLNLDGIGFSLSYESFVVTIAVFAVIFACVMALGSLAAGRLDISELLKKAGKGEAGKDHGVLPGLLGVFIIACSFVLLYSITHNKDLKTNNPVIMIYFLTSFTGAYLTISHLGKTILRLVKRNKGLYYSNMLVTTEIYHKFSQHKRIIFVLSVLSSMIVFLVASPYSLLSLSESIAGMSQQNHLEYAEMGNVNKVSPEVLQGIISRAGTAVTGRKSIEFLSLYIKASADKYDLLHSKPVVSQKAFNSASNAGLEVPKGQAINIITAWEPGYHGIQPSSKIVLEDGNNSFEFSVKDSIHSVWVSGTSAYPSSSGIVLNDEDYGYIKNKVGQKNTGTYHIYNFKDWKKTGSTVQKLKAALAKNNASIPAAEKDTGKLFKVASRLEAYEGLKRGYSLFIFVTTAMGILFFIAAGSVLYFKQYTEMGSARAKFFKLYKLGITEGEAVSVIAKELRLTFFTPLIFGSILGYSFIYFMTYWVGGEGVIGDFMLNATVVVAAYFVFQALFYLVTKRKYTAEVLGNL